MDIQGVEGLSVDDVRRRVELGGRFVVFTWTLSFVVMTIRRPTAVIFIEPGESALVRSLPYTLISLVFGWWGIPWGLVYTPMSIIENLGGGKDVTNEIMATLGAGSPPPQRMPLDNAPPPPPSSSSSTGWQTHPGSAFSGEPGSMKPAPSLADSYGVDNEAKSAFIMGLVSLLCMPVGWLGIVFAVRAMGRARAMGLQPPGRAIAALVLSGLSTVCFGLSIIGAVLAPKTPPPEVSSYRPPPRVEPAPVDDAAATVQPGAGQGPHLELRIAKVYAKHKPSAKPPFHEPGGDWTFFDLQGGEGVELTAGVQYKPGGEMFSFGTAQLSVPDAPAGAAFTSAFDAQFGGKAKVKPGKPRPLKMSAAILGSGMVRAKGGGFSSAPGGKWTATKLFPAAGERQGEVFFNYSLDDEKAEFTEKDAEYADDLAFVFRSSFAGK